MDTKTQNSNKDEKSDHSRKMSASYIPYDKLLAQIKQDVSDILSNKSKTNPDSTNGPRINFQDLDWESDTGSNHEDNAFETEELVFRCHNDRAEPDLYDQQECVKVDEIELAETDFIERDFDTVLKDASLLADFHESFILNILAQRRLNPPLNSNEERVQMRRVFIETIATSQLPDSVMHEKIYGGVGSHVARITEIGEDVIQIDPRSRDYAEFIPLEVPILNLDNFL